jgi:hypothetical protein
MLNQGVSHDNYEAADIRERQLQLEAAAGLEPNSRCNIMPVDLSTVSLEKPFVLSDLSCVILG